MIWRFAALLVVLLSGHRDGRAQGPGAQAPSVPEAAAVCLSCHGPFGRPENLEYPIIGGQNAAYLAAALRAYRGGQRSGEAAELMVSVAQPLDDRTIDELAAFFATLRSLR
jgi:cytochrome c553